MDISVQTNHISSALYPHVTGGSHIAEGKFKHGYRCKSWAKPVTVITKNQFTMWYS